MDWSSFSIGNAAGFIKGPGKRFEEMLRSSATEITVGSITLEPRAGNPGETYYVDADGTSVNALGLPNPGLDSILQHAPDMARCAKDAEKTLRWSFAGFNRDEFIKGQQALRPFGEVEHNFGCPNLWADAKQKPVISYQPRLVEDIIEYVETGADGDFDIKVSPTYPEQVLELAGIILKSRAKRVIVCNTYPNGVAMKYGEQVLSTSNGYGGVGGNALYTIMLGQVAQYKAVLDRSDKQVIAVGGISSAERVVAARMVRASGVQIGTAYDMQGHKIFYDIFEGLAKSA